MLQLHITETSVHGQQVQFIGLTVCDHTAWGTHCTCHVAAVVPAERLQFAAAGLPPVCSQGPGVETACFWYKKMLSRQDAGSNPFVRQQQGNPMS